MPRRTALSAVERASLLAIPSSADERIRHYGLSEQDLSVIRQKRGAHNRLGFAVQLCAFRYPGILLPPGELPPGGLLHEVARQLRVSPTLWPRYSEREKTRREHLQELQTWMGLSLFGRKHHRAAVRALTELATHTDQGLLLAQALLERLRRERVIVPTIDVIERICAEAATRGTRRIYAALTEPLSEVDRQQLDALLEPKEGWRVSSLVWLRQPPGAAAVKNLLYHLERLQAVTDLALPDQLSTAVHQNRWMKLAREGAQMTGQHLRDLEVRRRHATLVAVLLDTRATLIDECVELHEKILGGLFSRAKRRHEEEFQQRLGELRDRSFENQKHRASGLNLVVAAIVLWNSVYLERAVNALRAHGHPVDDALLQHLSPLGWDHIALTGDYTWKSHRSVERGQFRALRPLTSA